MRPKLTSICSKKKDLALFWGLFILYLSFIIQITDNSKNKTSILKGFKLT